MVASFCHFDYKFKTLETVIETSAKLSGKCSCLLDCCITSPRPEWRAEKESEWETKRGVYAGVHPWLSILFFQGFYFWQSEGTLWMWDAWQSRLRAKLPPSERTTGGETDGRELHESQDGFTVGYVQRGPPNTGPSGFILEGFFNLSEIFFLGHCDVSHLPKANPHG